MPVQIRCLISSVGNTHAKICLSNKKKNNLVLHRMIFNKVLQAQNLCRKIPNKENKEEQLVTIS